MCDIIPDICISNKLKYLKNKAEIFQRSYFILKVLPNKTIKHFEVRGTLNVVCCVGRVEITNRNIKRFGVLPIWIVKSNVGPSSGLSLETLDFNIRIGGTPTFFIKYFIIITSLRCEDGGLQAKQFVIQSKENK